MPGPLQDFHRIFDFVDASYEHLTDKGMSTDEYYYMLLEAFDQKTIHDVNWRVKSLKDVDLAGTGMRVDFHFFVYDDRPLHGWEMRSDNVLSFECSFRRPILMPTQIQNLRHETWFKHLEFDPAPVPVLQAEEPAAEKIRAAFQRTNARDIFDLYQYGQLRLNENLLRALAVLKCWEDRGLYTGSRNFAPHELIEKLKVENYKWENLKSQVSKHAWIEPEQLLQNLRQRFAFLLELTGAENKLCYDKAKRETALHDEMWAACRQGFD